MEPIIVSIQDALMDGDAQAVKELTEKALGMGVRPKILILEGLIPGMKIIGKQFRDGEIFIPDVLMASRAMHAGLYVLRPVVAESRLATKGRVILGTVAGDLHDIGKNMVSMMLQGEGYEVIDIGIDVPALRFIEAVREHQPDILAMSALLTTTTAELGEVIAGLTGEGLRNRVKVLVGGGPVTPEIARAIEADAFAADAYHAVEAANRLTEGEAGFLVAI